MRDRHGWYHERTARSSPIGDTGCRHGGAQRGPASGLAADEEHLRVRPPRQRQRRQDFGLDDEALADQSAQPAEIKTLMGRIALVGTRDRTAHHPGGQF